MTLVIDILGFQRGRSYGFQEYLLNLLDDFSSARVKIKADRIILLINKTEESFLGERYGSAFEYKSYDCQGLIKRLSTETKIINELNLTSDDVLLFVGNTMPINQSKAKKVLVIHDLLYRHGSFFSKSLYYFLFRLQRYLFVPYSIRKADKVIAISNFTKDEIIEAYHTPSAKIEAIYNYFNFNKYDSDDITEKSTIQGNYILSICAKYKHKNHDTILKAFELFCQNNNTHKLVFVGGLSPEAELYLSNISNEVKNRIIICQHLTNSDIKKMYENASMYVSASLYEGLGMPVVEALYFGLPTLLSDIPIHHEVSLNNASFFKPDSPEQLARLMLDELDAKKDTNTSFRDMLIDIYSSQNTSMKYIDVINRL